LVRRTWEHKNKFFENSFTAKYHVNKVVYFEHFKDINEAIKREKQLKRWHRDWKINLIKKENPEFNDLTKDWTG
jgi:putative endonuclease